MTVAQRIIAALERYDPLPLDYDDLADEARTTKSTVQTVMTRLVRAGQVHRDGGKGRDALMRLNKTGAP